MVVVVAVELVWLRSGVFELRSCWLSMATVLEVLVDGFKATFDAVAKLGNDADLLVVWESPPFSH